MRLIETLAARRLYYRRGLPTLPDIALIDIPPLHAGASLLLGRFYPVVLETQAELVEFEAFLCAERDVIGPPDLFERRPSCLLGDEIVFARYAPSDPAWPWVLLSRWPPSYTALATKPDEDFARGAYTIDAFESEEAVADAEQTMLAGLRPADIRHIVASPDLFGRA